VSSVETRGPWCLCLRWVRIAHHKPFCRDRHPFAGAPPACRTRINNDQVRLWREVPNEWMEAPGAKIPGSCRTLGVVRIAENRAATTRFCVSVWR